MINFKKYICPALAVIITVTFGIHLTLNVNKVRILENTIEKMKKTQEKDFFNKKMECQELLDGVEKAISNFNDNPFNTDGFESLEALFFSPKENSCLYVTYRFSGGHREYYIYNALTKSKITSFKFPDQLNDYKSFMLEYSDGEIRL